MFRKGFHSFSGRRVLLLQGPVGPFFRRLETELRDVGASVVKINFNGGDWFFSHKRSALNFRASQSAWPEYLRQVIDHYHIDTVLLFGDCRSYHQQAHQLAMELGLDIGVFEEGYVRPNYVTFEMYGVNGHSTLSKDPIFYLSYECVEHHAQVVEKPFWPTAWCAMFYYFFAFILWPFFHRYQHHRPLHIFEGLFWIRSLWRKFVYKKREQGIDALLQGKYQSRFFLVPLQTHNDAQINIHSDYACIEQFIEEVIASFARAQMPDHLLVLKHHPLDRGYRDYTPLIRQLASQFGLPAGQVLYIHDQHLPSLLGVAAGVVVINSTVGLSAIHHGAPTKVMGQSIYNIKGLTYQGTLDTFWRAACDIEVNVNLYLHFKGFLIEHTQLNGSFYKPIINPHARAGLIWKSK